LSRIKLSIVLDLGQDRAIIISDQLSHRAFSNNKCIWMRSLAHGGNQWSTRTRNHCFNSPGSESSDVTVDCSPRC